MNKQYFSISKAIRNSCSQYKADVSEEYETKVIAENKRALKVDDADIVLTNAEMYQRAFPTGAILGPVDNEGKELITGDYLPQEFVTYLRPQLTLEKTGYYSIPVNGNSVSFAVCTSGSVAGMYDLDGELNDGDLKFATKTLTPKKAGVCIPVPYSLILQARPEIDAMVEADIVNALYQIRDEQILVGSGENGQCTGILNTTGINVLTGASLSGGEGWGAMLSGVNEIRKANVFSENLSFVMNGNTYVKLSKTPKDKDNCLAGFIIEDDKIKNYPVFVNNKLADDVVLVGDFGEVAVADF
jgi:HK97 family phage major capsid protein